MYRNLMELVSTAQAMSDTITPMNCLLAQHRMFAPFLLELECIYFCKVNVRAKRTKEPKELNFGWIEG